MEVRSEKAACHGSGLSGSACARTHAKISAGMSCKTGLGANSDMVKDLES